VRRWDQGDRRETRNNRHFYSLELLCSALDTKIQGWSGVVCVG